jgi:modulator of FtsH protease HflC
MSRIGFFAVTAILALMVAASTLFVVDQRQIAVVYALGEIKEVISEPGLKMKLPPPFQNVVFLDRRIQTLDSPETAAIFTAEKKSLVVDWLVKWRIIDSRQFIRTVGTDFRLLETRLSPVVQAAFNEEVTKRNVSDLLAKERESVMNDVKSRILDEAKAFGIEIVDVRIKRVDFVAAISDAVYRRMQSERQQVANELRSTGAADAEKIRADADRQHRAPRPTAMRRRSRARATPRPRRSMPTPSAATRSSRSSIAASKRIGRAFATRATSWCSIRAATSSARCAAARPTRRRPRLRASDGRNARHCAGVAAAR